MRETLNEIAQPLLGNGRLWDMLQPDPVCTCPPTIPPKCRPKCLEPGYQMHRKRCPNPKGYQDCLYYTLLSFLDQEKRRKKEERKTVSPDMVEANPAKRRKPTQVFIQILFTMPS